MWQARLESRRAGSERDRATAADTEANKNSNMLSEKRRDFFLQIYCMKVRHSFLYREMAAIFFSPCVLGKEVRRGLAMDP